MEEGGENPGKRVYLWIWISDQREMAAKRDTLCVHSCALGHADAITRTTNGRRPWTSAEIPVADERKKQLLEENRGMTTKHNG